MMKSKHMIAAAVGACATAGFATSASAAVVSFTGQNPGNQSNYVESGFLLDTVRLVNGNCESNATRPCLALNDNEATTVTNQSAVPFSVNGFWFQFLGRGNVNDLTLTVDGMVALVLSVATFGKNDGGQHIDLSGNPLFQNISSLTFSTGGGGNVRIDDIDLTPIPLPAALPLMAMGLGAAGVMARRRKKATA